MSDEESIFNSFVQEIEKLPPQISKVLSIRKENKQVGNQVKDALRRYTEKTQSYEYMVNFDLLYEGSEE